MFDWFWEFLYGITKSLLRLIDGLISCANKLCGIETVNIGGTETDLVSYMMRSETLSNAFRVAAVIGFVVLIFFTIARIIMVIVKEKPDMSPGQVAVKAFKTLLLFLFVPAIMITAIWALNTLMGILYSVTRNGSQNLGSFLFGIFSQDAEITNPTLYEEIVAGTKSYVDTDLVSEAIDLSDFDFLYSWAAGLVLLFTLTSAMVQFVDRAISIGVLFVVSPFSVASSVLDDGGRFKLWREQVLIKFMSGYGIILYLNIYCLLISIITPSSVVFYPDSGLINGIFKLLIIIGGAFAMQRGSALIGNLLSAGGGSRELMDSSLARLGASAIAGGGKLVGKGIFAGGKKLWGKLSSKDKKSDDAKKDESKSADGEAKDDSSTGEKLDKDPKYGDKKDLSSKLKNESQPKPAGDGADKKDGDNGGAKDNASGEKFDNDKNDLNKSRSDAIKDSLDNFESVGSINDPDED